MITGPLWRDAGDVVTSPRSANAADTRPPPRPAGSLASLLAHYMQPGMAGLSDPVLVTRALPASLGAGSKVGLLLRDRP